MAANWLVIVRVLCGILFIVSGFEKLIVPYQNFLYVVQSYECLTIPLEEAVARVMPWIELFVGVFMVLGLWLKVTLRVQAAMITSFLVVVGQAMARGLPITECGCFGELISLPLYAIFCFDATLLGLTLLMIKKDDRTRVFSLDRYLGG